MNKSDFSRSRVGDRVWSPFGPECEVGGTNGKVISVWGDNTLSVIFDSGKEMSFWRDGICCKADSFPTLFHCRPKVEIPPPPRRTKWVNVKVMPYGGNRFVAGIIVDPTMPPILSTDIGPVQVIEVEVYDD